MNYRRQNARNSNFATEPFEVLTSQGFQLNQQLTFLLLIRT
jgi:hypothetical protein